MKYIAVVNVPKALDDKIVVAEVKTMLYRLFPQVHLQGVRVIASLKPEIGEEMDVIVNEAGEVLNLKDLIQTAGDFLNFFVDAHVEFHSTNIHQLVPKDTLLEDFGIRVVN